MPETDLNGGINLGAKLRIMISKYSFNEMGQLTASFGVAESRGKIDSEELIGRADTGMYEPKNTGRNKVYSFG